jgi:hypothetical protein
MTSCAAFFTLRCVSAVNSESRLVLNYFVSHKLLDLEIPFLLRNKHFPLTFLYNIINARHTAVFPLKMKPRPGKKYQIFLFLLFLLLLRALQSMVNLGLFHDCSPYIRLQSLRVSQQLKLFTGWGRQPHV